MILIWPHPQLDETIQATSTDKLMDEILIILNVNKVRKHSIIGLFVFIYLFFAGITSILPPHLQHVKIFSKHFPGIYEQPNYSQAFYRCVNSQNDIERGGGGECSEANDCNMIENFETLNMGHPFLFN